LPRKQLSLIEEVRMPEEKLADILPVYEANKSQMDLYKKLVDKDNKEIKSIMLEANITEFVADDIKAICSVSVREDFIEEALINKLKEIGVPGIIKQKEYVDMDALENAIYNGKINAAALADCQIKKEIVTLRVNKLNRKED